MATVPDTDRHSSLSPGPPALTAWELKPVIRDPAHIARARATFDLYDVAVRIQRQNLRRRYPEASEQEITRHLRQWLVHRPGAEHGDASGPGFRISTRFVHLLGRAEKAAAR
jgi:hypothetical protein